MASDLHPLSDVNIIVKYADIVNLLVPENTDIQLHDEFAHIQQWADENGMVLINLSKTRNGLSPTTSQEVLSPSTDRRYWASANC